MQTPASLLERLRTQPDEAAWRRLDDLYRPLIRRWLLRDPTLRDETDDLVQEVMGVVVRGLPGFFRERPGSFRRWLRTVTIHRLKDFWRSRHRRPQPLGDAGSDSPLAQLEDPGSDLSRQWDREHDQHVVQRLLEMIEGDFAPQTWQAFRRVVLDDAKPAAVALELGVSVNVVLLAKSRVLARLRQEGQDLVE